MAESRKIEVTQDHINRGLRRTSDSCPVALALDETLGGAWDVGPFVGVDNELAWRGENHEGGRVDIPESVATLIEVYDATGIMQPFTFIVDA